MKKPSRRFLFTALFYGLGLFFLTHFDVIFDNWDTAKTPWFGMLAISLLVGCGFAWTMERAETYIERKNARWREKREAEKQ